MEKGQHNQWAIQAISGIPGQVYTSPWSACSNPSFPTSLPGTGADWVPTSSLPRTPLT